MEGRECTWAEFEGARFSIQRLLGSLAALLEGKLIQGHVTAGVQGWQLPRGFVPHLRHRVTKNRLRSGSRLGPLGPSLSIACCPYPPRTAFQTQEDVTAVQASPGLE